MNLLSEQGPFLAAWELAKILAVPQNKEAKVVFPRHTGITTVAWEAFVVWCGISKDGLI